MVLRQLRQYYPKASIESIDSKLQVSLNNVRIIENKKDIGTYICECDIHAETNDLNLMLWVFHDDRFTQPYTRTDTITYKSELVQDKQDAFRVELMKIN